MRGHRTGRNPWWFSSTGRRFDVPAPRGTCYPALDAATAIRETVGEALAALGVIPLEFAAQRCLSDRT